MTFILGMQFATGALICADTLESGGSTKKYRSKIESIQVKDWGLSWAGSGNAAVVDRFSSILHSAMKDEPYRRQAVEEKIDLALEAIAQQFTRERIEVVFLLFGPRIKANIKKRGGQEVLVYKADSYSCCAAPVGDYCIAGMDVTLASFFLTSTYTGSHLVDFEEAKRLAICVTALMKKYADGVDGKTELVYRNAADDYNTALVPEPQEFSIAERLFVPEDFEAKIQQHWGDLNPTSFARVDIDRKLERAKRKVKRSAVRKARKGRAK